MSRRQLVLSLVTVVAGALTACTAASPTQPSSLRPAAQASRDVVDPATCRGGWNSSTGRCN